MNYKEIVILNLIIALCIAILFIFILILADRFYTACEYVPLDRIDNTECLEVL